LCFIGEPEDVDRLLWSVPPVPSPAPVDDGPSFEFEFADHSLPDVYKLPSDGGADDRKAGVDDDDWVLFDDVSTALSVKTVEALAKLLDDENAVTAVPADLFNKRAVLRKSLGRQPVVAPVSAAANKSSAAERPSKDDNGSVATKEGSSSMSSTSASTSISTSSTTTISAATSASTTEVTTSAVSSLSSPTSGGEQILLVRYDRKLKQLLGVNVYTVS